MGNWRRLGVSARRARTLAASGRVEDAAKVGRDWLIPAAARVAPGKRGPRPRAAGGATHLVLGDRGQGQALKRRRQRRFRQLATQSPRMVPERLYFVCRGKPCVSRSRISILTSCCEHIQRNAKRLYGRRALAAARSIRRSLAGSRTRRWPGAGFLGTLLPHKASRRSHSLRHAGRGFSRHLRPRQGIRRGRPAARGRAPASGRSGFFWFRARTRRRPDGGEARCSSLRLLRACASRKLVGRRSSIGERSIASSNPKSVTDMAPCAWATLDFSRSPSCVLSCS